MHVAQIKKKLGELIKIKLLKLIREAEAYNGPSLISAYAPCINHGIKNGMGATQLEIKLCPVQSGYWALYRYKPNVKRRRQRIHSA